MRLFIAALAFSVMACGGQESSRNALSRQATEFNTANNHSNYIETRQALSASATMTLKNVEFDSPRRIEIATTSDQGEVDKDVLVQKALQAALAYNPGVELKLVDINRGDRFSYVTFQQTSNNREVFGARINVRVTSAGNVKTISSTIVSPALLPTVSESVSSTKISTGRYYPKAHHVLWEKSVLYPQRDQADSIHIHAAREFAVYSMEDQTQFMLWIDEETQKTIAVFNPNAGASPVQLKSQIVPNAPGEASIEAFFPNLSLQLADGKVLEADETGRIDRDLLLGDSVQVSLKNPFVLVANALAKDKSFDLRPQDALGEEVILSEGPTLEEKNTYYWLMQARQYLDKKLNFQKMSYQMVAVVNFGFQLDNAFFMPLTKTLSFGAGSKFLKNTALSRDIVLHEYGHAVTNMIYGLQTSFEFRAMDEAFSDYFAATITGNPEIAEGAMQERTGMKYLRNVENNMVFPRSFTGISFHDDGQMFSGALWNLRKVLGAEKTDKMVHEARLAQATTIFEFYKELLAIDEDADDHNPLTLSKNAKIIRQAFAAHGLGNAKAVFQERPPEDFTEPRRALVGCWTTDKTETSSPSL